MKRLAMLAVWGAELGFGVVSCAGSNTGRPAKAIALTTTAQVTTSTLRITSTGPRSHSPPAPAPCPAWSPVPSMDTGSYCGPHPRPGDGHGRDGLCTGQESDPPCAAGVIVGMYYAYTVPGDCMREVIFDGRTWWSELPTSGAPLDVWMRLAPDGSLRFIGPAGSVGFDPAEQNPRPGVDEAGHTSGTDRYPIRRSGEDRYSEPRSRQHRAHNLAPEPPTRHRIQRSTVILLDEAPTALNG